MKLDAFLKTQKVRCVKACDGCLKVGKEYDVVDISVEIKVKDDGGDFFCWESDYFEPVLEPAENPEQGVELTPEFEVVEPVLADNSVNTQDNSVNIQDTHKFKAGDRVYVWLTGKIARVTKIINDDVVNVANKNNEVRAWVSNICHANPENYERLQATFPDIEFERPLTQADIDNEAVDKLAQAMKNKLAKKREKGYHGWETCKHGDLVQLLINHVDKGDPIDVANFCAFLFARG